MNANSSNPNIEWKKSGFGTSEKTSLKIDNREASLYKASKKLNAVSDKPLTPADLPVGLKKIRKKIKDVFDEDDEEEEGDFIRNHIPLTEFDESNSLLNALSENEKQQLNQRQNLKHIKMQNDAGKLEALSLANYALQDVGLKGLSQDVINKNMQQATLTADEVATETQKDLAKRLRIKDSTASEGKYIQVLRGISNIRKMSGLKAIEGLNLKEVAQASDEKKAAKILLKKTGRKNSDKSLELKQKSALVKQQNKKASRSKKNLSLHLLKEKTPQKHF